MTHEQDSPEENTVRNPSLSSQRSSATYDVRHSQDDGQRSVVNGGALPSLNGVERTRLSWQHVRQNLILTRFTFFPSTLKSQARHPVFTSARWSWGGLQYCYRAYLGT